MLGREGGRYGASPAGPAELRARKRGVLGCFTAVVLPPLVGLALAGAVDVRWAVAGAALTFAISLAWSAVEFARSGASDAGPPTWSFAPLSAAVIAACDVFAFGGDLFGPGTYLLLALPCAFLGACLVFFAELRESRRPVYSSCKAVIAAVLIAIPLPVGGLVGAGASIGHRYLGKRAAGTARGARFEQRR